MEIIGKMKQQFINHYNWEGRGVEGRGGEGRGGGRKGKKYYILPYHNSIYQGFSIIIRP